MKTTPDIKAEIVQKVQREGMTVREAMRVYGVSRATIYGWLNRQAREQNIYLIAEVDRLKKELDEAHRIIGVLTTETLRRGKQVSSEKQKEFDPGSADPGNCCCDFGFSARLVKDVKE